MALLVLQLVLVYAARSRPPGFTPARAPDTRSYIQAAEATTLTQALSHYRTYGYPLFLKLVAHGGRAPAAVPTIQFCLYSVAVLVFWLGLRLYTGSAWLAFAGATPLPYAFIVNLVRDIMTDLLAATLTIFVVSVMLALGARPRGRLLWLAFAVAVFATYQVRPAGVFLIVWGPAMAVALRLLREATVPADLRRWLLGLTLAGLLPYLVFAGTRRVLVGHFGLVSFGGTNLAGVAACFLDEELVSELPQEHRPLARSMLGARQRSGWAPMTLDSDARAWFLEYSDNIWRVALAAADAHLRLEKRRLEERGQETQVDWRPGRIRRNGMLTGVSRAIIRARPRLYLKWVGSSFVYGLRRLPERPWVVWPFVLLVCSAPVLAWRRGSGGAAAAAPRQDRMLWGIFILGVSYFLIYLLLLSLVSWPFPRYFSATILLLPSALCVPLFEIWRRVLRPA